MSLPDRSTDGRISDRIERVVAGRRPGPITWGLIGRVLVIASIVSGFLSLFGPFDEPLGSILIRVAHIFAYGWIGGVLGIVSGRLTARLGLARRGPLPWAVACGLTMAAPMFLVVWFTQPLPALHLLPLTALPDVLWNVILICVGASTVVMLAGRGLRAGAQAEPAPPKFLERLPLKLRGGELWAVEAEDHYLRLHTSKGQDLILLRLADAVAELEAIEGAQVHRSWWVARDAIAEAERGDGRAILTLKDGTRVPVSRTYAKALRKNNWI